MTKRARTRYALETVAELRKLAQQAGGLGDKVAQLAYERRIDETIARWL